MASRANGDRLCGRTHRWTFTEGPTKGATYEHAFHPDGTVSWRAVEDGSKAASADQPGGPEPEKAKYAAFQVAPGVVAVSYLAKSGFTLTVVLSDEDHKLVGFASNDKQWFPVRGTFEVARAARAKRAA
jgi:hypothetical protein